AIALLHLSAQAQPLQKADRLATSNRRLAEEAEEMMRLVNKVTDANAELEQFAFSAAHELRAPLRSLRSVQEKLLRGSASPNLPRTMLNDMRDMRDQAERMDKLLLDLIGMTRAGRTARQAEVVDLGLLLADIETDLPQGWELELTGTVLPARVPELPCRMVLRRLIMGGEAAITLGSCRIEIASVPSEDGAIDLEIIGALPGPNPGVLSETVANILGGSLVFDEGSGGRPVARLRLPAVAAPLLLERRAA
ncbi:MAG: hypothetical protein AAGI70_13350, partial [Pseudomonadota bacterium]